MIITIPKRTDNKGLERTHNEGSRIYLKEREKGKKISFGGMKVAENWKYLLALKCDLKVRFGPETRNK